jgi:hypothetical protein
MTTAEKTEVRARPIIFTAESIQAMLDDTKTQTRRVVKPQPPKEARLGLVVNTYSDPLRSHALFFRGPTVESPGLGEVVNCPYGKVGDLLWVKENFFVLEDFKIPLKTPQPVHYSADGNIKSLEDYRKVSSLFMPRWASRLTLEITSLRVERVQAITDADALAEGVAAVKKIATQYEGKYASRYKEVWEKLNKKFPWESNPWVFVIEFKRRLTDEQN